MIELNFPSNIQRISNIKKKSIYKIKHILAEDKTFQEEIKAAFHEWTELKEGLCPLFWWEHAVKKGIKQIAIRREKQMNRERKLEGEAL